MIAAIVQQAVVERILTEQHAMKLVAQPPEPGVGAVHAPAFQQAVVDTLVAKVMRAVEWTNCSRVLLGGGVARNGPLRERLSGALGDSGRLFAPSPRLATDNAAMVACLAEHRLRAGEVAGLDLNADPSLPFPGLTPLDLLAGRGVELRGASCIPS